MTSPDPSAPPDRPPEPPQHEPMLNAPPVTIGLVLGLGAIFAMLRLGPESWAWTVVHYLSLVPARVAAVAADPLQPETLAVLASFVTHALIHLDGLHFAVNAGFLLAFGSVCERALGRRRYIVLLLGAAAGGAAAQLMADWAAVLLMHGASGAVTGCMGGTVRLMMSGGADPAGRRFALVFVAVLFVLNLLFGVFGPTLLDLDARIAWQAHIGGFIAGFLIGRAPNPGAALGILQDGGRDR